MSKKRKRSAAPLQKREPPSKPENPFEQLHQHKKFDVIGKRQKGDSRNLIRNRADAVDKRNKSLLVEYKQLRKANSFWDNRFGEEDATMTAEERALARFQKERMKEERGSRFALADEGQADLLTHLGRSLADTADFRQAPEQDGEDHAGEDLPAELVDELHFGGFTKKPATAQQPAEQQPERRSKKDVMDEVMAKSKAYKAAKQQQREEDLAETEQLDDSFAALLQGGALAGMLKAKGKRQQRQEPGQAAEPADAAYDKMRRELVYEPKGKVTEPEKPAEQLQEAEQQRQEAAEKRRLKRMRAADHDDDSGDDVADAAAPAGGFAARRHRQKRAETASRSKADPSGDALEDDFALDDDDEASGSGDESADDESASDDSSDDQADPSPKQLRGLSLEQRRQARAAGSHELQQSFREAAAKLLQKHGIQTKKRQARSESAEDESAESDSAEGESADEQSGSEQSEEAAGSEQSISFDDADESAEDEPGDESASDESSDESAEEAAAAAPKAKGKHSDAIHDTDHKPKRAKLDAMTKIEPTAEQSPAHKQQQQQLQGSHPDSVPETYAEFAARVKGMEAAQLGACITAIRSRHAASLAANARRQLQVLYGIVLQHFAKCASQQPVPMTHLDVLMTHLLAMTPEVPFYAAMSARARLSRSLEQLQAALSSPHTDEDDQTSANGGWPDARTMLLLKLWTVLFPVSDRKHPVAAPASLLIGSYLANCHIRKSSHIATGLFLAQLGIDYASPAQRFMPEPLGFACTLISSAVQRTVNIPESLSLQPANSWTALQHAGIPKLELSHCQNSSSQADAAAFKAAALLAAVAVIERGARECDESAGMPEALSASLKLVQKLQRQQHLPLEIISACKQAAAAVEAKQEAVWSRRKPMQRSAAAKTPAVKLFNPRFEEEFVAGKDYDPDRERAEKRKLKRQVHKEQRGAVRELRKDAAFLHAARETEAAAAKRERSAKLRAGRSFMEQQASDMASGGQKGLWRKKKRK